MVEESRPDEGLDASLDHGRAGVGARQPVGEAVRPVVRNEPEEHAVESRPRGVVTMEPRRRYGMTDQHVVEQAVYRLTPAGTQEVADLVGISRQAAAPRLRALVHREHIWSKKVGPTDRKSVV